MNFDTPLAIFQHLLSLDEQCMEANLIGIIDKNHPFYPEVEALISAHKDNIKQTQFNRLIHHQASHLVEDSTIHELLGKQVGAYQLIEKLGEGGMGAVYLGERNDGQLTQKVAIKFVYPSISAIAGENFLSREAQHLANLEHINIAKLFTVEKTTENLPYMVMEFIDGLPLDQYCKQNNLSIKARLVLFKKVCNAVHYAHQNMVLHADIKPSNILVDKLGEPKLMDFGIARTLNNLSPSNNLQPLNAVSQQYSSPEQLKGEPLTTASDIYSLGVLLKTILLNEKSLNSIVLYCSSVNAAHRYASVKELKADINNWLNNYPLLSEKNTLITKTIKTLQRNKLIAFLSLASLISIAYFTHSLHNKNLELAESLAKEVAVTNFMTSIFKYTNKNEKLKIDDYSIHELLEDLAKRAVTELADYPVARVAVLYEMAKSYQMSKQYETANSILNQMDTLYSFESGKQHLAINFYATRAYVYSKLGKPDLAKKMYKEIENIAEKISGSTEAEQRALAQAAISQAFFLYKQGYNEQVKKVIHRAINNYHNVVSPKLLSTLHNTIGVVYTKENHYEKGLFHLNKAIDILVQKYNNNAHSIILPKRLNLIDTYISAKQYDPAITKLQALIKDIRKTKGKNSALEAEALHSLANIYRLTDQCSAAYPYIKQATLSLSKLADKIDFIIAQMEKAKIEACLQHPQALATFQIAIDKTEQQYGLHSYKHLVALYRFYQFKETFLFAIDAKLLNSIHSIMSKKFPNHPRTKEITLLLAKTKAKKSS